MHALARAVAVVAAAFVLVGPAVGADPVITSLPALDTSTGDEVAIDLVRYRGPGGPGPATYFFTEATFFQRNYDVMQGQYGLQNSAPSLNTPPGTLPTSGFYNSVSGTNISFNSTYDPYAYSWGVDPAQTVNSISSPYSSANQFTGAPRLTLGHVFGNGWGVQGRYWTMENAVGYDGLNPSTPAVAGNFNGVLGRTEGSQQFAAQTIDLEATRDLSIGRWWGLGTIGARYAEFTDYRSDSALGRIRTGADPTNTTGQVPDIGMYSNAMYSFGNSYGSEMYGTGLTFSLQGLRPIADSDFAIYTLARGSTLWGETRSFATSDVAYDSFYGSDFNQSSQLNSLNNQTYYIAELQLGVQWSRDVRWLNGRFFTRAGFEYQWWRGLVNQANAATQVVGDRNATPPAQNVANSPVTVAGGNTPPGPATVPVANNTGTYFNVPANNTTGAPATTALPQYLRGIGTTGGFASQSGGIADFDLIGFSVGCGFMW